MDATDDTATRAQDPQVEGRAAVDGATSQPTKILFVDDEPDVEALFRMRFRGEVRRGELAVYFAENGVRALDLLRAEPEIAVVITDLNMPEMDGLTLLAEIAQLGRTVRTIVVTAYSDMTNIRTAMRSGAFDFQVKPLDIDDLRATLAKAVGIVQELRAGEAARTAARALSARNEELRQTFGRYVSDDIVEYLLASPDPFELRSSRRELTVMMADIRGFSVLSEQLEPERVVDALNSYLSRATEAILRWRGTINEILGDGLLVFFGAPLEDPRAPEHAVAAALELQLAMDELNAEHREHGLPAFSIGIGIHTGDAIVGTIGSQRRMKYAAVGRNVNLAARIESNTVGGQILISDATYARVRDVAELAGRHEARVKGVQGTLVMHEVRGMTGDYGLHLTQETAALRPLTDVVAVQIAPMEEKRIGESSVALLVAAGPDKVRLLTSIPLDPMAEVQVRLEGEEIFGKVLECHAEGHQHALTVNLTAVSHAAAARLEELRQ
jgi:adenylate cyclase